MALADFFKKKKPEVPEYGFPPGAPPQPLSEVPVSDVISMQQAGLSNNQIIQSLQRQGYSSQQIYDALAQAEAKKSIEPLVPEPEPQKEDFEAAAERLVEQKWGEFQRQLSKVNEWKDGVDSRLDRVEQQVKDLRADIESLHKAIVDRVGDYDRTLSDVGTEVKAMGKVFEKVLPEFTSNVQELSRITKRAKQ